MNNDTLSIGQIGFTVADVSKSLVFYRDILGLTFLFSPSDDLAFLQSGQTRLMLSTPQGHGEIGKNSILYFKVEDIDAFFQSAITKGAAEERQPQLAAKMPDHDLWIGFLRDPDNNLIGLMEEKSSSNQG